MDRGVWQATIHGVSRVAHNLVTKPPSFLKQFESRRKELFTSEFQIFHPLRLVIFFFFSAYLLTMAHNSPDTSACL